MGFLKSVIADARPAKSLQRSYTSPASVSVPMPVTSSSDNMLAKSSGRQSDSLLPRQSQTGPIVSNTPVLDRHHRSSQLSNLRDTQAIKSERLSRPEKNNSHVYQAKHVLPQQITRQSEKAAKPVSLTSPVQRNQDFPQSKSYLPSVSMKPGEINADSSDLSSVRTQSLEKNLSSDPATDFPTQKMPAARARKYIQEKQDKKLKQSSNTQTPIQPEVRESAFDTSDTGFSKMSVTDEKVTSSGSNESQLKATDSVVKSFNEVEFKHSRLNTEASNPQQTNSSRGQETDTSAQNVSPDIATALYTETGNHDSQQVQSNPDLHLAEKAQSEMPSAETRQSVTEARLHNLDSQVQQQTDKTAGMQVMAAQTTNMVANQLASQHADLQSPGNPVRISQGSAEVRIGQVDVFIEKPVAVSTSAGRSIRPSISMASRQYLRRL